MRTPDRWDTARATVAIAVATGLIHLVLTVFELSGWAVARGSFVPATLTTDLGFFRVPFVLTPLTATLIHADLFHLIFNLLIFLICGRAVEGAIGPVNLVILYVVGAFAAAGAQFALDPAAQIPMIGASGAISAVIGAYAMLFGKNRVPVRDPRLALWLNVLWLLAAWVVLQVAMGIVLSAGQGILLAVGAHVGGFVAGVALARPLLLWRYRKA
ncbi:MAG TPA: rhomboid family intramembrane serine protease [Allosphingosinicella sp.]|jgi:membrane associated rhomboid family serine protease|nr:rhomboid family intramembrane serine protease [Allosphingosinicella sp.]